MFTAHKSVGKTSEKLLGFALEVFFGYCILLLAVNIGIYQTSETGETGETGEKSESS